MEDVGLKLYTKKNCPACENVKSYLAGLDVPVGAIQFVDITNDLVSISRFAEGKKVLNMTTGEMEVVHAKTLPILEAFDKPTLTTTAIITPSQTIIEFLSQMGFPVKVTTEVKPVETESAPTTTGNIAKIAEPDCEACQ